MGTLLGLRPRLAAAGGIALSLMLFLTVSFHAAPYYTGADIVFVFAWTPLLLAGSGPVLSLDAAIANWAASRGGTRAAIWAGTRPGATRQARRSGGGGPAASRREVVLTGMVTAAVAVATLAVGGLAAGLGRLAGGAAGKNAGSALPQAAATGPASHSPSQAGTASPHDAGTAAPGQAPPGKAVGPASGVPVGQAASFTDPSSGDPSIVIQPTAGTFVASTRSARTPAVPSATTPPPR